MTIFDVLAAHVSHLNYEAGVAMYYGGTVEMTVHLKKSLKGYGDTLKIKFDDYEIVENNLRDFTHGQDADYAATFFVSPLHNLDNIDEISFEIIGGGATDVPTIDLPRWRWRAEMPGHARGDDGAARRVGGFCVGL